MEQSVNTANQQWVSITTLAAQARSAASATPASSGGASGGCASAAEGGRRGGGSSSGEGGDDDDSFPGNNKSSKGNYTGNSVNAQDALARKMAALEKAQKNAVMVKKFDDGRVRYYEREKPADMPGPTRGRAYVTEHYPPTKKETKSIS